MSKRQVLTFVLMDAPFESTRTTTTMRLLEIATRRGYHVNVFAYEGAVALPYSRQSPHANAVHGHDADEEQHPLPKDWIAALIAQAANNGGALRWVNCGLCVDERGVGDSIDGTERGTPADLWAMAGASDNTLVVPTR